MSKSFKHFLKESTKSFGISHVEDLGLDDFIDAIKRLHKLEAAQKLDGANLGFGLDADGRLYTTREQKGGKRFYELSDFPRSTAYDGFKAAHAALQKVKKDVEKVLKPGQAVNAEVLYGPQPNTVHYGKDGANYIAVLEPLGGDDPTLELADVAALRKALKGAKPTVQVEVGDTADGESITYTPETSSWEFTEPERIDLAASKELNFDKELKKLEQLLEKPSKAAKALGKELSNYEVLQDKTRDLAPERQRLNDLILNDFKLPIKKRLLTLVQGEQPKLDSELDQGDEFRGIEGIVFADPETGSKFKVVDRDEFSEVNKFFYQARKRVAGKILTLDQSKPIELRGGLVGDAKLRALKVLGLGDAALPSQAKKVLAKFGGDTKEELLANIEQSLQQLSLPAVKRKLQAVLISAAADLEDELNDFKKSVDDYKLELPSGKQVKYPAQVRKRTLLAFAEAKRHLHHNLKLVREANNFGDLVNIFLGRTAEKAVAKEE